MKRLEKCWLVSVKYYLKFTALVRYCVEPIQTNPNNLYWNDNKPALKIPSILTFNNYQKIENKKAVIWNIRVCTVIRFHQILKGYI